MPQMAPYNWLMLFILFNIILLLIITINNYMYMYMPIINNNKTLNFKKLYTWKW